MSTRRQNGNSGGFSLEGYVDVAERIREFREKHPEGSLQTVEWRPVEVDGHTFIYYQAAAYRSPEDCKPGIGAAWEPFPGKTPYTKDSELQNAETSAWGRAIVAALASSTQRIASAEEVRNRQADRDAPEPTNESGEPLATRQQMNQFKVLCEAATLDKKDRADLVLQQTGKSAWNQVTRIEAQALIDALIAEGYTLTSTNTTIGWIAYKTGTEPFELDAPADSPADAPAEPPIAGVVEALAEARQATRGTK